MKCQQRESGLAIKCSKFSHPRGHHLERKTLLTCEIKYKRSESSAFCVVHLSVFSLLHLD